MKRIRRALISVWDKKDLVPFALGLRELGIQIISTGGTATLLKKQGIPVREVADFTGFPEILAGRVKTLHPKVHGGILARRGDRKQLAQARRLGLELIDLVVVNLYPFEETARRGNLSREKLLDEIDIGGVALIRSAAKNFESVGVISSPAQYGKVLQELRENRGSLSEATRLRLAVEAFTQTAYYDAVIHQTLACRGRLKQDWPGQLVFAVAKRQALRYGENPHQQAAWYQWPSLGPAQSGLRTARQLHGKELSFNNILDLDSVLQIVSSFGKPTVAIVKHNNPCGVACGGSLLEAFRGAFACDPLSAFGGIVGLNRLVDRKTAQAVVRAGFLECLIAPGYEKEALQVLKRKKNLRILQAQLSKKSSDCSCREAKQVDGGFLIQEQDRLARSPSQWRVVTKNKPTASHRRDLNFAWTVAKLVRSNAIVVAKAEKTVGIGAGQTSRVDSVAIALKKAGTRARGAVLASDGFFPKPDGPQRAVKAGIRAIVQPGGSIRDPQVIQVAQRSGVSMLLTGERHFRH